MSVAQPYPSNNAPDAGDLTCEFIDDLHLTRMSQGLDVADARAEGMLAASLAYLQNRHGLRAARLRLRREQRAVAQRRAVDLRVRTAR